MAKIHVKVVTGEEFTISNAVAGAQGPMTTLKDAQVQVTLMMTRLASVTTDQGKMINVPHIVYTWIVE